MTNESPATVAAVLWDMDGTLVDTEPAWIQAEYNLVAEFGGTWSEHHAHQLVGSDLITAAKYIRDHGGVDMEPEAIVARMLDDVIAAVGLHLTWQPGARELLAALRLKKIPSALVTMSYANFAHAVIDQLPAGTFQAVITGDSVTNGKPHPEPYLVAAAELGVDPAHCIALEDSPTGVASAEAAGCVTIAIPHVAAVPDAPGRIVIGSLKDLTLDDLDEYVRDANA